MDVIGPFPGRVDADLLRRYREATNDRSVGMPPAAIVTQIWDAQEATRAALVPEALQSYAGVHGEHDVVLHRPLVVGEPLRTWVARHGVRPAGRNVLVTLRYETRDADDAVVAEQWWTTAYLGTSCEESGQRPPDHAFPDDARDRPLATYGVDVDAGMARRYAEASGDWSAHTSTSTPPAAAGPTGRSCTGSARWRCAFEGWWSSSPAAMPRAFVGWRCGSRRRCRWTRR